MKNCKLIVWSSSNFKIIDTSETEPIVFVNETPCFENLQEICKQYKDQNTSLYFTVNKDSTVPSSYSPELIDILVMNNDKFIPQYGRKVELENSTSLYKLYSMFPTYSKIILSPKMVKQITNFKNAQECETMFFNSMVQNIYSFNNQKTYDFEPNLILFLIIFWITYFYSHRNVMVDTVIYRQKKFPTKGLILFYSKENHKYELLLNLFLNLVKHDCKNSQILVTDNETLHQFLQSYESIWKKWNIKVIDRVSMIDENPKLIQLYRIQYKGTSNVKELDPFSLETELLRFCYKNKVQFASELFIFMNPLFCQIQRYSITKRNKIDWSFLKKLSFKKSMKFNRYVIYRHFFHKNFQLEEMKRDQEKA